MMTNFFMHQSSSSSLENITSKNKKTTPNTAVPCPSSGRLVRICEVCRLVMDSILTSMPSVPLLTLLGAGESTVSSWKTDVETSSCLMGLNETQQKIRSEAKQKKQNNLPLYTPSNGKTLCLYQFLERLCLLICKERRCYVVNKRETHYVAFLFQTDWEWERIIYMSSLKVIPIQKKQYLVHVLYITKMQQTKRVAALVFCTTWMVFIATLKLTRFSLLILS